MNIYPAIDLLNGQCVRLYKGSYDHVTVYESDPLKMAQLFAQQGAKNLHIVDLDGAKAGQAVNLEIILAIKKNTDLIIQTGGGIRTYEQAKNILNKNIDRIIVGSVAVSNPSEIKNWIREFGPEKIVLALDVRNEKLAVHGWEADSEKSLWELLDEYQDSGLKHVLCTDINLDGTLSGPNVNLYKSCVNNYPDILFQASGGMSNLNDLSALAKIPVSGIIIGKALYENKFTLSEALRVS
ncbi:MAG TPA: 1-(5-phosphoribosyl)-5-[(5-phosphoribosylamino)methylideneamino]imidazole-4-carboxamide isomerase [Gammaproteobacteria bacterium]|nr:1-(5-phosphoribosyl)-5-[(5-phosphoribosylamino)methylideneamino]imidazole-4-carboxamide isomerase [Gammaproteobacteria bacterium]